MTDRWHDARVRGRDLGRQIARRRERLGVTQAELAAIVGCGAPALSQIECGWRVPAAHVAARLDEWCLQASESEATPPVGGTGAARPVSARWSDPASSHATVRSIAADRSLADLIIQAAQELRVFDDGDLQAWLAARGRPHDRNVVACARNRTDHGGLWVYIGLQPSRTSRVRTKHFALVTETAS